MCQFEGRRCPSDGSAHRSFRRLANKYCGSGKQTGQDQLEELPAVFREGDRAGITAEAGSSASRGVHKAVIRGGTIHAVRALTENASVAQDPEIAALAQQRLEELEAQALVSQAKRNATAAARRASVKDSVAVETVAVVKAPDMKAPEVALAAANKALNEASDARDEAYDAREETPGDVDLEMAYREAEEEARAAEKVWLAADAKAREAKAVPVVEEEAPVIEVPVVEEALAVKAPKFVEAPTTGDEHIALQQAEKDAWEDLQASRDARDALVGKHARSKARMSKTGNWDTPENEAKRAAQDQAYQDATDEIDAADEVRRASAKAAKASTWKPAPYVPAQSALPRGEAQTPEELEAAGASEEQLRVLTRALNPLRGRSHDLGEAAEKAEKAHARSLAGMQRAGTAETPRNKMKLEEQAKAVQIANLEHWAAQADGAAANAAQRAHQERSLWIPGTKAAERAERAGRSLVQNESYEAADSFERGIPDHGARAAKLRAKAEALRAAPVAVAPEAKAPAAPKPAVAPAKAPEVPVAAAPTAKKPRTRKARPALTVAESLEKLSTAKSIPQRRAALKHHASLLDSPSAPSGMTPDQARQIRHAQASLEVDEAQLRQAKADDAIRRLRVEAPAQNLSREQVVSRVAEIAAAMQMSEAHADEAYEEEEDFASMMSS